MESRVKDIVSYLEIGIDEVRMIGIKGMGGAGKTTTARAVFDHLSNDFEARSFVENVREVSNGAGLKKLLEQVLSNVLTEKVTLDSVNDGKNMMKRRMCGQKVLLVLDDVDHIEQLKALAGEPQWFKPGSRILITTRDEQVLVAHRVNVIRGIVLLSKQEAISLFSRYAFGRENPLQGYEELSGKVVRYAAGLPLTLEVLGSFLCGKDKLEWEDAIDRLKSIPLKDTMEKLELSYIGLEGEYKEIFLDIACILKGKRKADAIRILECCGFHARIGLKVLEQRSLITIREFDQTLGMHDHIEELGKNIVRRSHPDEPNQHSHLWIDDEIEDILANDMGTEATRYLRINKYRGNSRILMNVKTPWMLNVVGRSSLAPLDCLKKVCFESLSGLFTVLPIHHYIMRVLDCNIEEFPKDLGKLECLEELCLYSKKIKHLPDSICMLKHLKRLILDCGLFLEKLPEDLGRLECLETLHVNSKKIEYLPDSICKLKRLKLLDLRNCCRFGKLPEDIGQLESLEILNLSYTSIKHLPDSICMLKHLKFLNLFDCFLLEKLPEDLGQLECLETLYVSSQKIKYLPDSICMLKRLKWLYVTECCRLGKLPEDIGQLESLERLDCSGAMIEHLPDSICMLKHLKYLNLHLCAFLEKLPKDLGRLDCLEKLDITHTRISYLPQSIFGLKGLSIVASSELLQLYDFPSEINTTTFHFRSKPKENCSSATLDLDGKFLDLCPLHPNSNFPKLRFRCYYEEYLLSSVGNIEKLISFGLFDNGDLEDLPEHLLEKLPEDLGQLDSLEKLKTVVHQLGSCPDDIGPVRVSERPLLEVTEDLGRLECLEQLDITYTGVSRLPQSIFGLKGMLIAAPPELLQLYDFPPQIETTTSSIL
ncbi:Toll/interleukin-1 receptor domain-containing protein [Tanacetum coccineum]